MRTALLALWFAVFLASLGAAGAAFVHAGRLRREKAALRDLVARLKDLAWDQRELDPHLSTIIIDEIRTYEKKELRG
ncbi:hypothetical protein [Actinopolymorpha alba]|uniref:hypothetical protein n=1 Tax=Actinopolymorpha alba TaxID=533267 RepID=UPI0003645016|nr:hypothetical protein [Actinopolymorpha alba]